MPTFDDYVSALQRLFVIEDVEAWCPAIRSAAAMQPSGAKALLCRSFHSCCCFGYVAKKSGIRPWNLWFSIQVYVHSRPERYIRKPWEVESLTITTAMAPGGRHRASSCRWPLCLDENASWVSQEIEDGARASPATTGSDW